MWIVVVLGGWILASLLAVPRIGGFIVTHLQTRDEPLSRDVARRDIDKDISRLGTSAE